MQKNINVHVKNYRNFSENALIKPYQNLYIKTLDSCVQRERPKNQLNLS